jgi:hypothetical protein
VAETCAVEQPDPDGFLPARDLIRGTRSVIRGVELVWVDPGTAVQLDGRTFPDQSTPGLYSVVIVPRYMAGDIVRVTTIRRYDGDHR